LVSFSLKIPCDTISRGFGVADDESDVAYAPAPSSATVDAGLKIFEETANVTFPDRLLPSAM
jgi:hypothetical protein